MKKTRFIYLFFCLAILSSAFSQKGKHGAQTVSVANVKVNEFTSLTSNATVGNTTINVAASSLNANTRFTGTLAPGDLIMIIQMQGALIKLQPYNPWEPFVTDSLYGLIYSYETCGNHEFAEVKSVISSTQIELTCGLQFSYSSSGKTQIVRIPRYSGLNVTNTGTLTTDAWNGTIGGILAVEVDGNTTINGIVSSSGLGFRGGATAASGGNNFVPLSVATSANNGAEKGEGIGSDRLTNLVDSVGKYCKGAPGNGGGGGNANNCGGGGGGNGGAFASYNGYGISGAGFAAIWNLEWPGRATVTSSGGGKGGYGTSTTTTANINSVGPNNTAWGSFKRLSAGGFGGRPLDYSTGRIFMGGGGGGGHSTGSQSNGANACSGGAGGGIIYFLNYGTLSGSGTISSNGANGNNAFGTASIINPTQGIDGAGGAGAGGTIILKSNGTISGITTNANGGNGGNQVKSGTTNSEGQGPGGGGSGGYIAATNIGFTQSVNGGSNGTTNATAFDTEFPMNGATSGDIGTNNQIITPSYSLTASANQTLCTNQSTTISATSTNPSASIQWFNTATGGTAISTGSIYATPIYAATGTYTVYAASCPGIYRLPIVITVSNGAIITVNSPTICPNQTVTLTANGASTYTWNNGATTNTISVSPTSTSIYTINASAGSCNAIQTATVTVSSQPTVSVANASICSGNSATLTAIGAASYTWTPGGQTTSSVVVTPTTNTTYTITGSNGACTNSTTSSVSISTTPTLSASSQTICSGQVATFTVNGATSYTWNPGNTTGSTYTTSPASSGTVSVLGTNGTCTAQITRSITVNPNPIVAASNQTICPSQSVTLTASGATTYSWNNGATTNTISVSPSSLTIYTVIGTTASCSNTKTVSVTVASQPTIAVVSATICSGSTATLTSSGATNYTWTPGGQTTSNIVVTPTTNTSYTITGSNGTCSNTTTATVSVTSTPTLVVNSITICPGQTATLTATGATSYTWNPGNVSGSSYTIAPGTNTTVTIIGSNGTCSSSATASVTIGAGISISVNSETICAGQTVSLIANGATTYTWDSGANTSTLNVSPTSTTVYTISGSSGSCNGTNTATVTVVSQPTVTVNSTTICSGSSATLVASGANNYTWTPGGQTTSSIVVTPTTNTTYSITGSNGTCSNTTISTVSVTATPTLIANSVTICPGQTATLTASGASSYTWNPGNVSGNSYTIAPGANTTVTIIGSNGTCSSSATASVTIGAGISISVNSETICAGQTASLTANGATTYTWDSGANTSTLNVSPISTTVYTISGSSGSCNGTNTATVTVVSQPTTVTVNSTTICSGVTATLSASGGTTYTWNPGNLTGTSISVSPTISTTYTITGSNGTCSNTTTATVSVTSTPTLVVNSVTICPGQTATLTATGSTSYTWNPGNISGSSYTIAPGTNTTVTIIGANGTCSSSATASVTIGAGISISVNSETICPGQTATLTATGATTYTWDSGSNNNSITVSPLSTTIYTISGASGSCFGNNTSTVTITSQPTITVSSATICSGSSATLTASGASTYSWNPGSVTGSSISISPSVSTTYTITGSNGVCTNTSTSVVSVINCTSSCSFSLGNDTSFCSPLNFTINGPVGYNSYLWLPGGTTNQNLNVTSGGTYTCTATIYSNDLIINGDFSAGDVGFTTSYLLGTGGPWGAVSNAGTYSVTTNPNLAHTNFFSFGDHTTGTGNMMVCNGASSANTVVWSQTISIVPNTNYNFSAWVASTENMNAGDEAQLQFSINGSLIGSVFNAPLTGGNWVNFFTNWNSGANTSATITIVDQNTIGNNDFALDDIFFQQICTYSDEITITENIIPTVTASASNSVICNGNTTSLIGGGASTYTWTSGVTNGAAFSPTVTTTYTVIGTSVAGCTNTAIQTITVNPTPTITVNSASICSGQTATIIANGAITYTWSNNVNGNSQTVNPSSTTIYMVSGTDINGCVSNVIATSTVNINTTPVADFYSSEGYTVTVGNNITLTNISSNADTYEWNVLCTGLTSNANNLNIAFVDTGNCCINLVANTIAGCSDTIQKCISIVKEAVVVIPNVFTPNGDGSNDVFKINSNGLKTLTCAIYDRWGLKIYEWDGINGYWDGTTKSGLAADGTYFYIATYTDFKDKSTAEKGFLNLFKN